MRLPSDRTILIALNVAIVLCAEFVGRGTFFYEHGIIQTLGFVFVVLAVTRMMTDYRIFDPAQKKLVQASLLAMLLLSASQIIAYFIRAFLGVSEDIMRASIVNLYLAGMLLLMAGCRGMLQSRRTGSVSLLTYVPVVLMLFLSGATVVFTFIEGSIDLELGSWMVWSGAALVVVVTFAALVALRMLAKSVKVLHSFAAHLFAGIVLLGVSALVTVFHERLFASGVPIHQFENVNFFLFSTALTAIFLAFGQLKVMSGIYRDIAEEARKLGIE